MAKIPIRRPCRLRFIAPTMAANMANYQCIMHQPRWEVHGKAVMQGYRDHNTKQLSSRTGDDRRPESSFHSFASSDIAEGELAPVMKAPRVLPRLHLTDRACAPTKVETCVALLPAAPGLVANTSLCSRHHCRCATRILYKLIASQAHLTALTNEAGKVLFSVRVRHWNREYADTFCGYAELWLFATTLIRVRPQSGASRRWPRRPQRAANDAR